MQNVLHNERLPSSNNDSLWINRCLMPSPPSQYTHIRLRLDMEEGRKVMMMMMMVLIAVRMMVTMTMMMIIDDDHRSNGNDDNRDCIISFPP